jgi:hypothetical protein
MTLTGGLGLTCSCWRHRLPIIVMSIIWVPNRRLQGVAGADDGNQVV